MSLSRLLSWAAAIDSPASATFGHFSCDASYFIADEVRIRRFIVWHNSAIKIPPYLLRRESITGGTPPRPIIRGGDSYVSLALSLIWRCISFEITSGAASSRLRPRDRDCESRRASLRAELPRDKIVRDVRGILSRPLAGAARRIRSENPIFPEPFRCPCLDKGCHLCFPLPFLLLRRISFFIYEFPCQ